MVFCPAALPWPTTIWPARSAFWPTRDWTKKAPTAMPEPVRAGDLTTDEFLGGRFRLRQPRKGLRAGSDALFLAACVPAAPGEALIEGGVGTGAAALAVMARVPGIRLLGVESHAPHAELARQNAALNDAESAFAVVEADITVLTPRDLAGADPAPPYDHAFANPPYFDAASARAPATASRGAAHLMPPGALANWIGALVALIRDGGTLTIIHKPDALPGLLAAMAKNLGAIAILPLAPQTGRDATRIIVQGRKASRAAPRLLAPLVLHRPGGEHTSEAEAVLRRGAALGLAAPSVGSRSTVCRKENA